MRKKTVHIIDLIRHVNMRNGASSCDPKVRQGWNSLLEYVLMDANVYAGYDFYEATQLTDAAVGMPPGLIPRSIQDGGNLFPDETRRYYYVHKYLTGRGK